MTETPTIKLALVGTSGRMGRALLAAVQVENNAAGAANAPPPWWLHSLPTSRVIVKEGDDFYRPLTERSNFFLGADVVIDFSHGSQAELNLRAAYQVKAACLIGTTALPREAHPEFKIASFAVPVMHAPNASAGFRILAQWVEYAVRTLDDSLDIDILDFHHADKLDAPSGTALALAGIAHAARLKKAPHKPPLEVTHNLVRDKKIEHHPGTIHTKSIREGTTVGKYRAIFDTPSERLDLYHTEEASKKRHPGTIHITSQREGTAAGEHRIIFAGESERQELHHIAHDRTPFAHGALAIARWLASAPPGIHPVHPLVDSPLGESPEFVVRSLD